MLSSKRQVLIGICETPGWQPPEESSSIERWVSELQREGWVLPRLDGFEATPAALDAYPYFDAQADIAAESSHNNGFERPEGAPEAIAVARVATLIEALLHELPLTQVELLVSVTPSLLPPNQWLHTVALQLAERMR